MTEAKSVQSPQQDIIEKVKRELVQSPSVRREFPITSMSEGLANVIEVLESPQDNHRIALDVGTGCGIHSFLLVQRGFSTVLAIDRNQCAVDQACLHGNHLGINSKSIDKQQAAGELLEKVVTEPRILFSPIHLENLAEYLETKIPLIVFNPPAFFFVRKPDLSSPVASGVYSGDARKALEVDRGPLYQFFEKIVLPLLAPGGEAVCTWPGLERRAVERDLHHEMRGLPAHPADLLSFWFPPINVACGNKDVDRFYRHTAVISDHGLGYSFWDNFDHALQDTRCYSTLVNPSDWKYGSRSTFRFGVLRLRRSRGDANCFEVICTEGGQSD